MGRIMCDFGFLRPGRVFTQLLAVFACSVFVLVILCLLFCFFYGNSKLRRSGGFRAGASALRILAAVAFRAGLSSPPGFRLTFWALFGPLRGVFWHSIVFATCQLTPHLFGTLSIKRIFSPGPAFLRGSASARLNLSTRARKWREIVGALNFWQRRRRKSGGQLRFLC